MSETSKDEDYVEVWIGKFPSETPPRELIQLTKNIGLDVADYYIGHKPNQLAYAFLLIPKDQQKLAYSKLDRSNLGGSTLAVKRTLRPTERQLKISKVARNPQASKSVKINSDSPASEPAKPEEPKEIPAKENPKDIPKETPKLEVVLEKSLKPNSDVVFSLGISTSLGGKPHQTPFSISSSEILEIRSLSGQELDQNELRTNEHGLAQLLLDWDSNVKLIKVMLLFPAGIKKEIYFNRFVPQLYPAEKKQTEENHGSSAIEGDVNLQNRPEKR